MRIILIVTALFVGLNSCKKKETTLIQFLECHKAQNLDSISISNKLRGSWALLTRRCLTGNGPEDLQKNIKLTFNTNGNFSVTQAGNIITQGIWTIRAVDIDMWGLDISTASEYLFGRILFCEDKLQFNNSYQDVNNIYIDGCVNTFVRSN
jgi:hypothetical protein